MARFKMWLIPGLVIILALGGLFYFRGNQTEEVTDKPVTVQEEVRKKPKGFAKPVEPAEQKKTQDDLVAARGALHSGDVSDCDQVKWDETLKKQCEDNLNYANILKSGDETKCTELNDETLKTQCHDKIYLSAAVDEKDITFCDKITDPELKAMCMDQVQMILSRYATSPEDCSVISSENLRKQCEDNFHVKMSTQNLSIEGCDSVADQDLSEQCKAKVNKNIQVIEQSKQAAASATVAKTFQEILELCDNLNQNRATSCKDAVYPELAFDEKDLSHCDKISDDLKASECRKDQGDKINEYYLRQSLASNDKSLCSQISDSELKELCQNS